MKKMMKGFVVTLLMLMLVFISQSTTVLADTDMLLKDKTNKLVLSDNLDEGMVGIEGSSAAGKSITYKIEVPKGTLYLYLADVTDFKVEVYNSKNEVVKKIKSATMTFGDQSISLAKGGVALSKGKYKVKISPVSKNSKLNITGIVAMLKNYTSGTIVVDHGYDIAVTKGKTYKLSFEAKKDALYEFGGMLLSDYDPMNFMPSLPGFKIVDSAGKTVKKYEENSMAGFQNLKKGKYTIILKASKTGVLHAMVSQGSSTIN